MEQDNNCTEWLTVKVAYLFCYIRVSHLQSYLPTTPYPLPLIFFLKMKQLGMMKPKFSSIMCLLLLIYKHAFKMMIQFV